MMKLEPGFFRVQMADYSVPYGAKRIRPNTNTIHILRVVREEGRLMCYQDHESIGRSVEDMEDFEILSKFEGEPKVGKCRITLTFHDALGTRYDWSVSDMWQLRNVMDALSWLKKPFGFVARKSR